jgi:hypothetical protein
LVGIREHAKVRGHGQTRDFKQAEEIMARGYDADPALSPHLADRIKKDGKAATIEIGAVGEIEKETHAVSA